MSFTRLTILTVICVILSACNGGAGEILTNEEGQPTAPPTDTLVSENLFGDSTDDLIVFSSNRGGDPGQLRLFLFNLETKEITPLETGMGGILARWSPDNSMIVFSVIDVWNLYTIQPDGAGLTQITDFRSNNADWSPDGSQLVFQSDHDDEPEDTPDIYIIDVTGENLIEIQDVPPILDYAPRWSPDGSLILFISNLAGTPQLFTMHPDGSALKQITSVQSNINMANWSPDGARIVFTAGIGSITNVFVVDSDGTSNLTQLTDDNYFDDGPVFSPDGTRIMFFSNRSGNFDLWMINADGTDLVQLTDDEFYDAYPDW